MIKSNSRLLASTLLLAIFGIIMAGPTHGQPLKIPQKSFDQAQKMEQTAIARKDSGALAEAYFLYGKLYAGAGNNLLAKKNYLKSLKILHNLPPRDLLAEIYLRLCDYLVLTPNSVEDISYIKKAIEIFTKTGSDKGLAEAWAALGGAYHWRWSAINLRKEHPARFDSIMFCYKKQFEFAKVAGDLVSITRSDARIGLLYSTILDEPNASKHFQNALKNAELSRDTTALIHITIDYADVYIRRKELTKAIPILNRAKNLYAQYSLRDFTIQSHLEMAYLTYYKLARNWKQALEQTEKYHALILSTTPTVDDRTIIALQHEMKVEQTDTLLKASQRELELKTKILSQQKLSIISIGSLLAATTVLSVFFFRLFRKNQKTRKKNEYLLREQNHRVKNNLQVISSLLNMQARQLSDLNAKKAVQESQLRLNSMVIIQKKLYNHTSETTIEVAEFIPELAQAVLSACGYHSLKPDYQIEKVRLDVDLAVPVGLILTELFTNACKYAFADNPTPKLIISCLRLADQITITVADNGPGIFGLQSLAYTADSLLKIDSFGIRLIALQVKQLKGKFNFSTEDGTKFTMTFNTQDIWSLLKS